MSRTLFFDQTPVLGWRSWAVAETEEGLELRSVVYAHPWPAWQPLRMLCEPGGCLGARWPTQPHACGIHAFKERAEADAFPATWKARRFAHAGLGNEYVVGQVSLWGRVVEYERGFRGELAYPYALLLSENQKHFAARLAVRYGIDVLVGAPSRGT